MSEPDGRLKRTPVQRGPAAECVGRVVSSPGLHHREGCCRRIAEPRSWALTAGPSTGRKPFHRSGSVLPLWLLDSGASGFDRIVDPRTSKWSREDGGVVGRGDEDRRPRAMDLETPSSPSDVGQSAAIERLGRVDVLPAKLEGRGPPGRFVSVSWSCRPGDLPRSAPFRACGTSRPIGGERGLSRSSQGTMTHDWEAADPRYHKDPSEDPRAPRSVWWRRGCEACSQANRPVRSLPGRTTVWRSGLGSIGDGDIVERPRTTRHVDPLYRDPPSGGSRDSHDAE